MNTLPLIKSEYETKQESSPIKIKNPYDYFSVKIPKNLIENFLKNEKDERYVYFLRYGVLRRFDGEGDILFVEVLFYFRFLKFQKN